MKNLWIYKVISIVCIIYSLVSAFTGYYSISLIFTIMFIFFIVLQMLIVVRKNYFLIEND